MAFHRLILGDARALPELDDASVDLVVTSPPYWTIKDYGPTGQIGYGQTEDAYHDDLGRVFAECVRVLKPGCRMCVNIGDQFVRAETHGRYRVIPLHAGIITRVMALDVDFMGSIIWRKVTSCAPSGGAAVMGSFPYPRNGVVKLDYEHILLFKKPGVAAKVAAAAKEGAAMTTEEWNRFFAGHWDFPGEKGKDHLAAFPPELPRRLIRMFTFPGETVLDPFVGSGTTLAVAAELGRSCVGVDIDPATEARVRERLGETAGALPFSSTPLEVTRRLPLLTDAVADVAAEPFRGSVVRADDRGRSRFAGVADRVAEVTGPNTLITRAGRTLTLLGTIPKPGCLREATARLGSLVGGAPVLLTDGRGADLPEGATKAYVHLRDRTFANGRMLREGLLLVDRDETAHKHHARFIRFEQGLAR